MIIGYFLLSIILFQPVEATGARHVTPDGVGTARPGKSSPPPKKWMTLSGDRPEVVAQGGYSGFFPDSSLIAYDLVTDKSIPRTILYCNLHFTKDNDGFCVPKMNLANATNIEELDPKGAKVYEIYGVRVRGWFGLDYPSQFVFENVTLRQNIFTRQATFDGTQMGSPLAIKVDRNQKSTRIWLNIENNLFYNQHKISPERYLLERLEQLPEFISSPEIGFFKAFGPKLHGAKTKLVFVFLEPKRLEPTTNVAYGELVKNLTMIKSFASGILVPKEYIWPVDAKRILQPATRLVQDAHKVGLAVYASGFANDNLLSYNYSYDPAREYLQFVHNSHFSVDGLLSAFPSTASEAVGCLNPDKNAPREVKALIISHNGASGDFPGATDLAYQKAIDDGADIIDCSVQMSKDGTAFCSDRPDLMKTTTAATLFMDMSTNIPEIQQADGIFSFELSWNDIQSLKPQIESFFEEGLVRNPANKNSGKFMTLTAFLELAKTKTVPGVLINIENAAFLANRGLDIVGAVQGAFKNTLLDKKKVLIQSEDSSVLSMFKDKPHYQRVLHLKDSVGGVPEQVTKEIKKYADAVYVHRDAVIVASDNFFYNITTTIPALHASNISVYVGILKNEFGNLIFDYLSDPYVELATLNSLKADGFITDYPATAIMFARSSCARIGQTYWIHPAEPRFLFQPAPVAEPPMLSTDEVVSPPLPPVAKNRNEPGVASTPTAGSTSPGSSSSTPVRPGGLLVAVVLVALAMFT